MCLIALAIYSTEENGKDEYLEKTLQSLKNTVDFSKHRLGVSVNAFTNNTLKILKHFGIEATPHRTAFSIYNNTNIGTAEAINKIWKRRNPGENAIKMDDDVLINHNNWIGEMEEAIRRDPTIGQIGLKRKDLAESPNSLVSFYRSELRMLPHEPGEKWIIVEEVEHVMGTCQMYSSALLDKIGYLKQPHLYGFDDSLASIRSRLAGFRNVFLPYIDIDHIDRGDTPFRVWKEQQAGEFMNTFHKLREEYQSGEKSIYYNPFK